ncbi:hypothetical protein GGF46_003694 [Coemansia sp. RSA 552]|nr:hypothetical protein GGF46_003694 [Coemansia sp. RSA 552]
MVQAPAAPQRQRGHSMASSSASTAAPATTGTRRRRSRAEPRSPYIRSAADPQSPKSPLGAAQQLSPQSPRRTYRRHPKKDPNAPEKWRSAYQLFRDDVNQELHGQDIAFSEMSKIHSRRWAALDNAARDVYFQRSRSDKEEYQRRMAIYEQTPEFRLYEEYLEKFYKQDSTVNRVGRPKGAKSSKSKGKGTEAGTSAAALEYHHGSGSDAPHAGLSGSSSSPSPQPSYPSVARS